MQNPINAAHDLLGKTLDSGWIVFEKLEKSENATGAFFSVCYKVKKDKSICFLKAFDFAKFFQIAPKGSSVVDVMAEMINAYKYEKELSDLCRNGHVSKVVYVNEAGETSIPNHTIPLVPYLIFDLADGDIRQQLLFSEKLDFAWRLFSLHEIAVGLKQLHQIEVTHQDLKPSNILVFGKSSKIGDLGRSICKNLPGPYSGMKFSGDFTYAPPEIMYGYCESDWTKRVFATDCYLLGSMIVFYFTGISMSAMIQDRLPDPFKVHVFKGSFDEIKPYLIDAFNSSIQDFSKCINNDYFREELTWLIEKLCYPLPELRGHPKNAEGLFGKYSLERFISKLDLLHRRSKYMMKE